MEDATRWLQILGGLAVAAPMLLGRIPGTRPYARRVARAAAVLYLVFGVSFILWWLLIRPQAGA